MEAISQKILSYFAHVSRDGITHIKTSLNAKKERGVYAIEVSSLEANQLCDSINETKNIGLLVDCTRFYTIHSERATQITKSINDDTFVNALNTQRIEDTFLVCVWLYSGENAQQCLRTEEDFGLAWCAVNLE